MHVRGFCEERECRFEPLIAPNEIPLVWMVVRGEKRESQGRRCWPTTNLFSFWLFSFIADDLGGMPLLHVYLPTESLVFPSFLFLFLLLFIVSFRLS